MIIRDGQGFILHTQHTTYSFRITPSGHPEHLYYGKRIRLNTAEDLEVLQEKSTFLPGNTIAYGPEHPQVTLEDMCLEMSSLGKGDVREPMIEMIHADGSRTCDFLFDSAEISDGKEEFTDLPGSYGEKVQTLCITMKDAGYGQTLQLYYYVFEDRDVISRRAVLINESSETVQLNRLLSLQLDLPGSGYVFTTFQGAWAREMVRCDQVVSFGKTVNESLTGTSSNRANPFVMLSQENTSEDNGNCYGINLIYSGNHYEACQVSSYGKTRLVSGIHPTGFSWILEPGGRFESPEAILCFSENGFNGLSNRLHTFIRENIVRGQWQHKARPVLLNSWEANYFDISERKLLALAKAGKEVGIELFVMDDGWFGGRDDDTSSLGDWDVNEKKLPGGLSGLAQKIKALGMDFGIWVEPEMISVKSKLYEAHPDWAMEIPGKPHSEGRNQRVLDLSRTEVQDFIIEKMSRVFGSAQISYVKWDMNRIFSDVFSQALLTDAASGQYGPVRQGEIAHRYVCGFYRILKELTGKFPGILFEGCASGGNRFDLGMLCYFPQIWGSDNTDALCRAEIQTGYSYGYPLSCVSAHVSSAPNHQTLRRTPLETRFEVAAFGSFGYECNLCDMSKEELEAIREQIALYKQWREVLQEGSFYRGRTFWGQADTMYGCGGHRGGGSVLTDGGDNLTEWTCVSKDRQKAVGLLLQKLVLPNTRNHSYFAKGLDPEQKYHFTNRALKYNVKNFGDLVNTVAPIHVKQDSLTHNLIAKFVKMDGEQEDLHAYGDVLMEGGVRLKQAFCGTGYNDQVRYFQDFASRMYFMEAEK